VNISHFLVPTAHIGPGSPGTGFGTQDAEVTQAEEFAEAKQGVGDQTKNSGPSVKNGAAMLPPEIDMSEEQEQRLIQYTLTQLQQAESERWDYISNFARWKRKYRTKFPEFPKDWPLANSSQITIPIIRTAVQTATARVYQTIMAAIPMASVRSKNPDYQDFATDYEEFLELYGTERLDLENVMDTVTTECIKLGTSIVEVTTKRDKRGVMSYDPLTRRYEYTLKELYNGPIVHHIPIEDFWCRLGFQEIKEMPWCGKEVRLSWSTIKDMALAGDLDATKIDKLWRRPKNPGSENEALKEAQELEDTEPYDWQEYTLFELSMRWDALGKGVDQELLVYFHRESRTFLRKKFNTFRNNRRPWIKFVYLRVEHRFFGEGMAEILEHLQEEISTIHNQRIDNATVANLQIILVKKLIRGLSPGDRLWSGKIVKADQEDVGLLRLGEVYPSTVNNEQIAKSYAQEISGIGATATGQAQPVTRTTATSQLSLLEELNRRFYKPVKSIRKSAREILVHCTDLFVDYGTAGLAADWLGDERGLRIEETLKDPRVFMPGNAIVTIQATSTTVNREVEFQSAIAVMNLVVQTGTQMLQLAQQFNQDPKALGSLAYALVDAIKGPWKKVMQYSDASNVDEAIAVLAVLQRILPAPEDMGGLAGAEANANAQIAAGSGGTAGGSGQRGDGPEPSPNEGISRMEALLRQAGEANGRGNGVGARRRGAR
jgi:hypothetical protein